jgi:hypothetical protein
VGDFWGGFKYFSEYIAVKSFSYTGSFKLSSNFGLLQLFFNIKAAVGLLFE